MHKNNVDFKYLRVKIDNNNNVFERHIPRTLNFPLRKIDKEDLKKTIKSKGKENWKSKVQDKSSYKNYKKGD